MLLAALAVTVALVVQDQAPLRAAAHENAPRQTMLTAGDWLEVRGEQLGFLQVYDHRRERPGYVRTATVRSYGRRRDRGAEARGARRVPARRAGRGVARHRLRRALPAGGAGRRRSAPRSSTRSGRWRSGSASGASARVARAGDGSLAAQLEVAESYGVHFVSFERKRRDAASATTARRSAACSRSAGRGRRGSAPRSGLTDRRCVGPRARHDRGSGAREVAVGGAGRRGPREARSGGSRVRTRAPAPPSLHRPVRPRCPRGAGRRPPRRAAGVRDGQARARARGPVRPRRRRPPHVRRGRAPIRVRPLGGRAPPRAVSICHGRRRDWPPAHPARRACVSGLARLRRPPRSSTARTGVVWPSSVRVAPHDAAVVMAVELLPGWSELLVLHATPSGWTADTITPAALDPDIGYVELAGFSPDGSHLLVVREARASGPLGAPHTLAPWIRHVYDVVGTADLHVEKEVSSLREVPASRRWETAEWRKRTLALR